MIKGTRNQLANVGNKFQGKAKKVLAVCSAGLLRSPTLAHALNKNLGYNTRAVGMDSAFALIPLTQALIWWADEIVFVSWDNFSDLDQESKDEIDSVGLKKIILDIPDDYDYGDETLERICLEQYLSKK